jgi:hypothetical protein
MSLDTNMNGSDALKAMVAALTASIVANANGGSSAETVGRNMVIQKAAQNRMASQNATVQQIARTLSNVQRASRGSARAPLGGGGSQHYSAEHMPLPKGDLNDWIHRALMITGHTGEHLKRGLTNMIMHESGGRPNATNNWDSNAAAGTPSIGLMQTIGPTFNAYAIKGHRNIYNPVDNIIAGLRYAISRYGEDMVRRGGRHDASGHYIGY